MARWILLILGIVVVSAAIPLILALPPSEVPAGNGVAYPAGSAAAKTPSGKAYLPEEPTFNFGKKAVRSSGEHKFTIKNMGDTPLKLLPGSKTCMCTVANFENDSRQYSVPPGESTQITVTFNPKDAGKFEQKVSVLTSDPDQPEIFFAIRGEVFPPLIMVPDPPVFDFGAIPNDKLTEGRLALTSQDHENLQIVETTPSNPQGVGVVVKPLSDEEKSHLKYPQGYRVDVQVLPSTELGSFSETVTVKTDHPNQPEVVITVRGRRTGAIAAFPEIVRVQTTSSRGANPSAVLSVRDQAETSFEVVGKPEAVEVSIQKASDSGSDAKIQRYRLTLKIPPGTPAGLIGGEVVLKTNHPAVQTVRIPLSITVDADE